VGAACPPGVSGGGGGDVPGGLDGSRSPGRAPRHVQHRRPGPTDTPELCVLAPQPDQASPLLDQTAAGVPLGSIGTTDEIANAVLFLASDQPGFGTGSELFVDGCEVHL